MTSMLTKNNPETFADANLCAGTFSPQTMFVRLALAYPAAGRLR